MATGTNWKLKKSGDTPFDMYRNMVKMEERGERKWRLFAIASFGCLVICIMLLVWAIRLPKTVPLVITVSDWGEAKYVGNVSNYSYNGMKVPQIAIEYQIRKFVTNTFAIPTDRTILSQNLSDCYSALTKDSANKFTEMVKADNINGKFGSQQRTVEIESILKLSDDSYQVDFFITTSSLAGKVTEKKRTRGVLSTQLLEPASEDQKLNPLGIYITNFDFTTLVSQ